MTPQSKGGRPLGMTLPYQPITNRSVVSDGHTVKVTVTVDQCTFEEIDRMAREANCRVGRMAATILEVGLAALEQEKAS